MLLLNVTNIRKHFGPDPVLDGVTFELRQGHRVGLVGPNGCGKSTLMKIVGRELDADAGTMDRPPSIRIGYLEQHPTFAPGVTVWEEAESALAHLTRLAGQAEQVARLIAEHPEGPRHDELAEQFDYLQHQLDEHNAYNTSHRVEKILTGLGFASKEYQQECTLLSGGQQNRLVLAKLLLEEPDVMLLDEPSNHLDVEATEWLEDFLAGTNKAILLVSHDRFLLDKVTNRTLELYHGTVDAYPGNFTAYRRQKAERLEVQRRTYEKQQTEIAKLEDFIRKHHHGLKHAQAEDRRKKLERIEPVDPPREIPSPIFGFPGASRTGDIVMRVERLSKGFDETLFEGVRFDILRGERWGILGPNGCGKSTLLKCLLGELEPDDGQVIHGTGVKVGYFDQKLECLDGEMEMVEAIRPPHKELGEKERRDLLARFGLTGDAAFQKVKSLSGGERNRAALAFLSTLDANVLVLDEPTNHLDLWARERLEHSLRQFDGTLLFITHDRYFLNQVADHLIVCEPLPDGKSRWRVIEGNYDTYLHLVKEGLAGSAAAGGNGAAGKGADKSKSKSYREKTPSLQKGAASPKGTGDSTAESNGAKKKRRFPYRKVADIEADIAKHEQRIEELHAALADPEVLRSGDKVKSLQSELEEVQLALDTLYEHWEEAAELNW